MNLCPDCNRTRWPFVMAFVITSILAFITWLVLGLSQIETLPRVAVAGVIFLAVGGTLVHYVVSCLKRHCRHDHSHGAAHRPLAG
jgi:hypothetical protein